MAQSLFNAQAGIVLVLRMPRSASYVEIMTHGYVPQIAVEDHVGHPFFVEEPSVVGRPVDVQLEHGQAVLEAINGIGGEVEIVTASMPKFVLHSLRDDQILIAGIARQHRFQPARSALGKPRDEEKRMSVLVLVDPKPSTAATERAIITQMRGESSPPSGQYGRQP